MKISPGRARKAAKGRDTRCCKSSSRKMQLPTSAAAIAAVAEVFFRQHQNEEAVRTQMNQIFLFAVSMLMVLLVTLPGQLSAADKYAEMINCQLHQGACTQSLDQSMVTLTVTPRPVKAMQDLQFQVSLSGKLPPEAKPPYIDLGMPGMNMGPNRVQLKSTGTAIYEGSGVIVRCRSGRRTWQARVTIPGVGQTDFIFDVVY